MAYEEWTNKGYGICTDDLEVKDPAKIKDLITRAPKYLKKTEDLLDDMPGKGEDLTEWIDLLGESAFQGGYGIASILAEVIEEAEGISLLCCDDYNASDFLLYETDFPWAIKERNEENLTRESLQEMMMKYISTVSDEFSPVFDEYEVTNGD